MPFTKINIFLPLSPFVYGLAGGVSERRPEAARQSRWVSANGRPGQESRVLIAHQRKTSSPGGEVGAGTRAPSHRVARPREDLIFHSRLTCHVLVVPSGKCPSLSSQGASSGKNNPICHMGFTGAIPPNLGQQLKSGMWLQAAGRLPFTIRVAGTHILKHLCGHCDTVSLQLAPSGGA